MSQDINPPNKLRPYLPWKVKLFISTLSFAVDITERSDGTINRRLMNLLDFKATSSRKPINGVTTSDITVDAARNLWFRLFIPTSISTSTAVVFFFHGGGFSYLGPNSKPYDDFCRRLASDLPAIIISVNYRLAPEHRYPCQVEDCFDILKFIDESSFKVDGFPSYASLKHCFLAGDSAGGNLVHHVAVKASEHEFSNVRVIGNVLIQPFFGGEERTESETKLVGVPFVTVERTDRMWKSYLPDGCDRDHPAANVFGPNDSVDISKLSKFPASVVVVGGFDPLHDWQKRYFEGLKRYGKEAYLINYPNAIHSFYAYPQLPESSLFVQEIKDFMQKTICSRDTTS